MYHYPIYISLEDQSVIVAGAGKVGRRKISSLCRANTGKIFVFDPALTERDIAELENLKGVTAFARRLERSDIVGKMLVFAATSDPQENSRIAAWCASASILCNVADAPEQGSFLVPALTGVQGIMAAFSTDGKSPALARRIKEDARSWLEANYGPLLIFMGRARPLVMGLGLDSETNAVIFRSLAYSRLGELLVSGEPLAVRDLVAFLLPAALHGHIEELLDGLC